MAETPLLVVEGSNDLRALTNLLKRSDLECYENESIHGRPVFKIAGGVDELLKQVVTLIKFQPFPIGFVVDADPGTGIANRWRSLRNKLKEIDMDLPENPPATGFIGYCQKFDIQIGIWLMPDNQNDGTLESFLLSLIDEKDSLKEFAKASTRQAKKLGAKFREVDQEKAELATWLAWQETPGQPYGTAFRTGNLNASSENSKPFLDWFRKLYSQPPANET